MLRAALLSTTALAGLLLISAGPAVAADDAGIDEVSVAFSGPVTWSQQNEATPEFTVDTTISMTCLNDECTIAWPSSHYGAPPTWQRGQTRISQATPASGDLCAGTYSWAVHVDLTITADRITGTVDRPGAAVDCSSTEHRIADPASATIDIPRTSGDPCVVDRSIPCSTEESAAPVAAPASETPIAASASETPSTPDADPPDSDSDSDADSSDDESSTGEGLPVALIIGTGAAVAAAGGAAALMVQRNRVGQGAQTNDQLTADANHTEATRSDIVEASSPSWDTNLRYPVAGAEPGPTSTAPGGTSTPPDGGIQGE